MVALLYVAEAVDVCFWAEVAGQAGFTNEDMFFPDRTWGTMFTGSLSKLIGSEMLY